MIITVILLMVLYILTKYVINPTWDKTGTYYIIWFNNPFAGTRDYVKFKRW